MARADRDATASARTDGALSAIAAGDHRIKAFCDVRDAAARAEAAALDRTPPSRHGALHGVPIAIKEVFDVAGCRCSWGTPVHADRVPEVDSEVVTRLKEAGGVVIGTTTSTEYAMARAAPTSNPYALDRTPGASSSGSAAAVAARFADLAIGSQTIGSGIRPAAYCGILGLKPTYGAIPLSGAMQLSSPLDHAVIMARDLDLVELAFEVLSGQALNSTRDERAAGEPRIALLEPWFADPVDRRVWRLVASATDWMAGGAAGRAVMPDLVSAGEKDCLETILAADMWRTHQRDEIAAGDAMSAQLRAWFARGRLVSDASYKHELSRRDEISRALWTAFGDFDVIATVATTGVAPLRSEGTGPRAPQRVWTLLGCPALAVPIGQVDGLPVAVQLISRPGHERGLMSVARRVTTSFTMPPPPQPGAKAGRSATTAAGPRVMTLEKTT